MKLLALNVTSSRLNNDLQIRVEEEIRGLAIGVYQVGLVKFYVQEQFNENSEYEVIVNQLDPNLICTKLQSRQISSKSYLLWIVFDDIQVTSWYSRYKTGS